MQSNMLLRYPMLLALFGFPSASLALNNIVFDRFCIPDVAIPVVEKHIPIPVGCELIDCCPGCPGSGPLDWRISIDGRVLAGAELRFEHLTPGELNELKISGNARRHGERIVLGKGTSRIRGVRERAAGKVTVGSLQPTLRQDAAAQLPSAVGPAHVSGDSDAGGVRDRIRVQQFRGSFAVNSLSLTYVIRPCRPPRGPAVRFDTLKVQGINGGDNVVVLMDARTSAGCSNDVVSRSTGLSAMGNLKAAGGCSSEIAIFSAGNAMKLDTPVTTWTNNPGDLHTVALPNISIDVPVTVWIANGAAAASARDEMANANLLFEKNKVGVRFDVTYEEVWTNPTAVAKINAGIGFAPNGDYECRDLDGLKEPNGFFAAGRLNIYYVNVAITGRNCAIKNTPTVSIPSGTCPGTATAFPKGDGNITYIGTESNLAMVAHELGHAFGLRPGPCHGHTNGVPGFNNNNIMWVGGPPTQDHFSLGQVYRMNTHKDDWDGTMLIKNGLRTGPERECWPGITPSSICPALTTDWARP